MRVEISPSDALRKEKKPNHITILLSSSVVQLVLDKHE
jgi:hypothetical protein